MGFFKGRVAPFIAQRKERKKEQTKIRAKETDRRLREQKIQTDKDIQRLQTEIQIARLQVKKQREERNLKALRSQTSRLQNLSYKLDRAQRKKKLVKAAYGKAHKLLTRF